MKVSDVRQRLWLIECAPSQKFHGALGHGNLHLIGQLLMIALGALLHTALRRLNASVGRAANGALSCLKKTRPLQLFPVLRF